MAKAWTRGLDGPLPADAAASAGGLSAVVGHRQSRSSRTGRNTGSHGPPRSPMYSNLLMSWPPHSGPLRLPSGFRHPSEHWNLQGGWSETRHTETRPWAATKVCFLVSTAESGRSALGQTQSAALRPPRPFSRLRRSPGSRRYWMQSAIRKFALTRRYTASPRLRSS